MKGKRHRYSKEEKYFILYIMIVLLFIVFYRRILHNSSGTFWHTSMELVMFEVGLLLKVHINVTSLKVIKFKLHHINIENFLMCLKHNFIENRGHENS